MNAVEKPSAAKTPPAGPASAGWRRRELGVDLASVAGSGPHGRITEEDVKAAVDREHAAAAPRSTIHAPAAPLPDGQDDKDSVAPCAAPR